MTDLEYLLLAPVSLFVIIAPFSATPVFLAMTPQNTAAERDSMARLACIIGALVLLIFAASGGFFLSLLGVSIAAFQAAGGALLFLIALDMLEAKQSTRKISEEERKEGLNREDIAVTPLAVPLLVGPGAISTIILLKDRAEGIVQNLVLFASAVGVMLVTYLILRLASQGARFLNPLFIRVTQRLMGLLLAALAVQFIFNGITTSSIFGN